MPYLEHSLSSDLTDSNKIWRYIDLYKFMDVLETNSLFFSRIDKLGNDFEGYYQDSQLVGNVLDLRLVKDIDKLDINNPPKEAIRLNVAMEENFENQLREFSIHQRQTTFVNCWYRNEYDSHSQWRIYGKNGIGLQSTFEKLKRSLNKTTKSIHIFPVYYIDYDKDKIPMGNSFFPLMHKPIHFESEKEIRAILYYFPNEKNIIENREKYGEKVEVDLDILIENIYLDPDAPNWYIELIEKILKKYGLVKSVKKSKISEKPKYGN